MNLEKLGFKLAVIGLLACLGLSGCNTVYGFGRDMQGVGNFIVDFSSAD